MGGALVGARVAAGCAQIATRCVHAAARCARAAALLALVAAPTLAAVSAGAGEPASAAGGESAPLARIEARSANLVAVGVVHDDRMTIHLSRLADNAPVRDAALMVVLRGVTHSTTAEADGSYSLETKDLRLPGVAAMVFDITQNGAREELQGMLQVANGAGKPEDKNNARQLWWWVLNFGVCIGFLLLISRRRKAA
jgi:hypothetical protein